MAESTFKTNPISLRRLLEDCHSGDLQLPEFQRSFVWDEDRIKSLIASVSRAFPIGALMSLETGGKEVNFKPRPVEGTPEKAKETSPDFLLLDGQQRMTSLYQVALRGRVVALTSKNKKVKRWFYIDIRKALDLSADREEAIVGVPENRIVTKDFGREVVLDLSSSEREYQELMFPVSQVFAKDDWQEGFNRYWEASKDVRQEYADFRKQILSIFESYHVPVIELGKSTSREAVCVVFEKVNTGGKALDAFELVTAMYAAEGHELRKDWYGDTPTKTKGRHQRFSETLRLAGAEAGIIAGIANTDFLHAISLFYTRELRRAAEKAGKQGKELPAVSGNRKALLNLPLEEYKRYETQVEQGFVRAAKFLHMLSIYRIFDLPYQSQIIPLAAILADIPDALEHATTKEMLVRWYWNGVFGELYGSAVETRIGRDFMEVTAWLRDGGPEPSTVSETMFRADRLKTMRMRLSAAYKGVNALLMKEGAKDFRSGQKFGHAIFFEENVDIHHIFPQDWCKKKHIKSDVFDSIINKTPLSCRTNQIIGGVAPSEYLAKLERGDRKNLIKREALDDYLRSHLIDPHLLREDRFDDFMVDRQKQLLALIEQATGKAAYVGSVQEEGEENEVDENAAEAAMTIPAAGKLILKDEVPPTAFREIVLKIGAEGGAVTILRERKVGDVWRFQMKTDESTLYDFLSKEDQGMNLVSQTGYVNSFHEVLGLLNDRYPYWCSLYLLDVHPEFLDAVLLEVRKKGGPTEETRWRERLKEIEQSPAVQC